MRQLLFVLAYLYCFWIFFLVYASVQQAGWTKLSTLLKVLLVPPGLVFLSMDFLFNVTAGTLLFLQLPTKGTLTLSMRMAANIREGTGWRASLSSLIVKNLLLPFTADY